MSKHIVATVGEIAPGACKIVTVKGRTRRSTRMAPTA